MIDKPAKRDFVLRGGPLDGQTRKLPGTCGKFMFTVADKLRVVSGRNAMILAIESPQGTPNSRVVSKAVYTRDGNDRFQYSHTE